LKETETTEINNKDTFDGTETDWNRWSRFWQFYPNFDW